MTETPPPSGAHYLTGDIKIKDNFLIDGHGRVISLRGVNLGGNSKLPTHSAKALISGSEEFFDHRNVSFIGRPFLKSEAREHFQRLSNWGLCLTRILVPWEALEHSGPGIYDDEYIDSLIEILIIASEYGIKCFLDPHQDTWSRFSGGSGAPGWTFEIVGFDIRNLEQTAAVHYHRFDDEVNVGKMIWPTNYVKLASATMFSIFFGGDTFAPSTTYQDQSCQEFLVGHYIRCYQYLAKRIKGIESVIGIEAMNEPHNGYIGMDELSKLDPKKDLRLSYSPLPLQSFAMGNGESVDVEHFIKSWPWPTRKNSTKLLNKDKKSAWLPGRSCIWKKEGVWDYDQAGKPVLLKPHHFSRKENGDIINFRDDFYLPFLRRFALALRETNPDLFFFFEPIPNEDAPIIPPGDSDWHAKSIYAPHWYDLHSVFNKKFSGLVTHNVQGLSRGMNVYEASYFGSQGAKRNYTLQISNIVKNGREHLGAIPCLVGECGIPMDINEKKAFASGDYTHHNTFLDAVISAMELNLVHFTLWNYNPHNDHEFGDLWNGEDFSIFTKSSKEPPQEKEIIEKVRNGPQTAFDLVDQFFIDMNAKHRGGRALDAVVRPYAAKTSGIPLFSYFDLPKLVFELLYITPKDSVKHLKKEGWTTEIYVPQFHFGASQPNVLVSDGDWLFDPNVQTIYWTVNPELETDDPRLPSHPRWINCPIDLVTLELIETHNFHYFQMSSPVLMEEAAKGCTIS